MMKITCTKAQKDILIKDRGFPTGDVSSCSRFLGVAEQYCEGHACTVCKDKYIEWEITDEKKSKEPSVREIAEALSNCIGTKCKDCILPGGECRWYAGKMILKYLEKEVGKDKNDPITFEEAEKMVGQEVYREIFGSYYKYKIIATFDQGTEKFALIQRDDLRDYALAFFSSKCLHYFPFDLYRCKPEGKNG